MPEWAGIKWLKRLVGGDGIRMMILYMAAVMVSYCFYLGALPEREAAQVSSGVVYGARETCEMDFPARNFYAACLGKYENAATARIEAARLAERGAAGYIRQDGEKFCVLGAVYENQGDADSVCRRIESMNDMEAEVVLCAADALRLRVTAGEGQISTMREALAVLNEVPPEMNKLSYSLDDGSMSADTARTLTSVLYTRCVQAAENLETAAGDTEDGFCVRLMELTGALRDDLQYISSGDGPGGLTLSSAMKSVAISAMLGVSDMMDDLR